MKEFSFPWSEGFFRGIRPHSSVDLNSPYLYDAKNVRVGSFGLEPSPIIIASYGDASTDWPMPQWVSTSYGYMVAYPTEIFLLNTGTGAITSVLGTGGSVISTYDVADFGLYQVWTNGTRVVIRDYLGAWSIYLASITPYSVCNYKGQLIAGGFGTGALKNWVAWGGIGEVDLDTLLSNNLGVASTDYSTQKNTSGNRPMEFTGQVYNVKTLGSAIIVYGSNGIGALIDVREPYFGYRKLSDRGIINRGAVGGDENVHVFVDEMGYVWSIDAELNMKRLGYSDIFAGSVNPIVVSYDPLLKDFYISNKLICGLLSDGLTKVSNVPTSVVRVNKQLIGTFINTETAYPSVTLCEFDCKIRGIKTLTALEIGGSALGLQASVDYRYESYWNFRTGSYKTVTRNGTVAPMISAVEFRVHIKGSDVNYFFLKYVNVRYKVSDKRVIRGAYGEASPVVSGSGGKEVGGNR